MITSFLVLLFIPFPGESKDAERSFEGIVIFLDEKSMELKLGSREKLVYFNEDIKIENKTGKEGVSSLTLCQRVKVYYTIRDNKNMLLRAVILKPGYCP